MTRRTGDEATRSDNPRRSFLKKAGAIVAAAPVIESLSKEGLLVRSARAQTGPAGIEADFGGLIGSIS